MVPPGARRTLRSVPSGDREPRLECRRYRNHLYQRRRFGVLSIPFPDFEAPDTPNANVLKRLSLRRNE